MDAKLNKDILDLIVAELVSTGTHQDVQNVSLTCRLFRDAALPVMFASVQWPHASKHSEEGGLEFFPESLWPLFRTFALDWPDHWPDSIPPLWGDRYYIGGDYHPRHLDKLVNAMPHMSALTHFYISCPFYPPASIITALIRCPTIRELSIHDTPLYVDMIPRVPAEFHLDKVSLVPVAEALRVGEGPYNKKHQEFQYYTRDYRKKFRNDSLGRYAATAFLFTLGKADSLRHAEISGELCTMHELAFQDWPRLETLVLTGHTPRAQGQVELVDVVARMPALRDLRLLFATVKNDPLYKLLPDGETSARGHSGAVFSQLRYLAISNACKITQTPLFQHTKFLEGLVVCAISDLPRVPIALPRADVDALLDDMGEGVRDHLKVLRIMIEDKGNPELYRKISSHFPKLETLEVELCGYHDGKSVFPWDEFADAFLPLRHLKNLRACVQFPEFDEADRGEPWKTARKGCAAHFASHLPSLQTIGFEYRKRTGTHRYEDSWMEWDIERLEHGAAQLFELPPSWYRFPEVWVPEYLAES